MKYIKLYEDIEWDWVQEEKDDSIPDAFKNVPHFYEFLVNNNVLDRYIYNLEQYGKDLDSFIEKNMIGSGLINSAFRWSETPEGHDFWNGLDNRWKILRIKHIKYNEDINWDWIEEDQPYIPDEFKGNEDFYNFLIDNGVLDKFIYNLEQYSKDYFIKYNYNHKLINSAFIWSETPEGHDFWSNLNYRWEIYLKNKYK